MKTKKELRRQGDILFVPVEAIPEDAKEQKDGIIARGEFTGHAHAVRPSAQVAMMVAANIAYINAMVEEAKIDHQEHNTISLPAGNFYASKRQRVYTPDGWRMVAD